MAEKGVQAIDRAFDILELLSLNKDGLGVTEIGAQLGLNKSTAYRILTAMAQRGFAEKTHGKNLYKLGLRIVDIGSIYLNSIELKTESKPYLYYIASKIGQPSHLAILDGLDAVYIDKVDTITTIRLYSQIGKRIPAYCSALGKSLLSGLSEADLKSALKKIRYNQYTSNTITDKEEFMRQIQEVRQRGWAVDNEEHDLGARCIGAPVYDYRGKVIAAVSVSGDAATICPQKDELHVGIVAEAAMKISQRMGYKQKNIKK